VSRSRRQPMPELAEKISAAARAAKELRAADDTRDAARARFRQALTEAHEAGASYGLLGQVVGLSRQRVARIISR
jgi:hypothetical protein